MRLAGRMIRVGRYWAIEVPSLGVATQGRTKREAYEMIADAIESLVNKKGFKVNVFPGKDLYFEIGTPRVGVLVALLLRRQRSKHGLTLKEVSRRLGAKSANTYARYEQGKSVPTIEKLSQLLSVLSPDNDFVLQESQRNLQ